MLDLIDEFFSPANLPAELLWGCFIRVFGALFTFALGMLYWQVVPFGGEKGLFPIRGRLDRVRADYPHNPLKRFLRYPTLHWFFNSDAALRNIIAFGTLSGFFLTVMGLHSRLGLAIMWIVYLSHCTTMGFMYPWDCLLTEAAFLSLFLPVLSATSFYVPHMPLPLLTFAYRLLLFRVLFGFGKFKFIGASTKEFSYLRGFMVNQPMPTIFGWLMFQLPLVVHHFSLAMFFVSEMIVPWFYFSSGSWRIIAGLITAKLMFVIQVTGNFGFFNLLTALLCIPCFDGVDTVFARETLYQMVFTHGYENMAVHFVLLFLMALAVFFFPFNSWCTMSFFLWPGLSLPVNKVGTFLRLISPYHLVHGFGVFFPHSSAGVRWIPIIEGTDDERINAIHAARITNGTKATKGMSTTAAADASRISTAGEADEDGIVWREYEYKFMTTRTDRMPPFCAPWHQRLDQAILYEAIGMTPDSFLGTLSCGNRYEFNPPQGSGMLSRVCACLLQDNREVESLFRTLPFAASPAEKKSKVQALRISFYAFEPPTMMEWLSDPKKRYWKKHFVGMHAPTITRAMVEASVDQVRNSGFAFDNHGIMQLRESEMAHPEHYIAMCDSPIVQRLLQKTDAAIKSGTVDATSLIATEPTDVSPRLIQPISSDQVAQELWGSKGFVTRLQPLLSKLSIPASNDRAPNVPQLDFEFHLAPGVWSHELTAFRNSGAAFPGASPAEVHRLEKICSRASVALLHRLLPLFHGPGADEMTTAAQILEATARRSASKGGKQGVFCIRKCKRDECKEKHHLHLPSFYHLFLFTQHIISQGRSVYESVLLDPTQAGQYVQSFSVASTLAYQALFTPSILAYHASKIRVIVRVSFPYQLEQSSILPGFLAIYNNFLIREFRSTTEGAFSPVQFLPDITAPVKYDQYWTVDSSMMKVKKAPGLITLEEEREGVVALKKH